LEIEELPSKIPEIAGYVFRFDVKNGIFDEHKSALTPPKQII
jgi:hypothetical protein